MVQSFVGAALPPMWATEQTPRDNMAAGVWRADAWTPASCPTGLRTSDTGVTYCQFAGALFELPLSGLGAIAPYLRMNEHCGSRWPAYARCPAVNATCAC